MTFTLQLDDPSLLILLAIIALALLSRSGLFTAQPLTHPLVFARQGEPSATRVKGKSPVYKHWSGTNGAGLRPENGVVGLKEVLKAREGTLPVDGIEVDLWKTSGRLYTGLRRLVPDTTSDASIPIAAFLPSKTTKETFLPTLLLNLLPAHDESEMRYHLVKLTDKSHLAHAFRDEDGVQLLYTTVPDVQTVLDATTTSNGHIIVPSANGITPELEKRVSARGWRLVTLEDVISSDPLAEKIGSGKASEPAAVHSVHYINGPEGVPQRGTVTNQVCLPLFSALQFQWLKVSLRRQSPHHLFRYSRYSRFQQSRRTSIPSSQAWILRSPLDWQLPRLRSTKVCYYPS